MKLNSRLLLFTFGLCAPFAAAQAPAYFDLSPGSWAQDVTIVPGVGGSPSEVVVVGTEITGTIFRWTFSSLTETYLVEQSQGGNVRVSADGTKICATTQGLDGIDRAARWSAGTWTQGPGLGGQSGTSETTAYGISGDGNVVGGLGWVFGGGGHAYRWTQPSTAGNLGGSFSEPSSRLNAVNGDGSIVVGWKDQLTGTRRGAYWVNGVLQPQLSLGANMLGEAFGVNASGTKFVGYRIFGGVGVDATAGWRWDAGVVTVLPNLAGEATNAAPTDITDDGSIVVGHTGGNLFGGTRDLIWVGGIPLTLKSYLTSLGTTGIAGYPDLGLVSAISGNGGAICGRGTGLGSGQPSGGWVVIFPQWLPVGTNYCFGDGTGLVCPCANNGASGNGCASSVNAAGGHLNATGIPSITSDSMGLFGSGMPNAPALYFQGTTQIGGGTGVNFGDGLRCAGGTVIRMGTKTNVDGLSSYPNPGDASISVRGLVPGAGSVRMYQCWYRNAAAFCTTATFNLTNAVQVTWLP